MDQKKIRIGIIVNENNKEDFLAYKNQLSKIDKDLFNSITIVLFGFKEKDIDWLKKLGFKFELVKPVSLIHYFKQLKALNLDMLFVPLIKTVYNITSEDYNKYLEAGLLSIPIIAPNIYPYNKLIQNKVNGFLFNEPIDFVDLIDNLYYNQHLIKSAGKLAQQTIVDTYNFSEENINIINELFV